MRLALEPEAAALITKEQNICRQEKDGNVELAPFTPGSTLMVIDLGVRSEKVKNCASILLLYIYISQGINVNIQFCVVGNVSEKNVFFFKMIKCFLFIKGRHVGMEGLLLLLLSLGKMFWSYILIIMKLCLFYRRDRGYNYS